MSALTSSDIRKRFLNFFEKRGHAILPSASLVPENDPSVLFNTAGMQPLVPYLMGQKHPSGARLASAQKCVRTGDLEEIGDNRHLSFFEMLGNWSLGDYFKEDAIKWSYEFLTSQEEGLGLDSARLYVTVFEGDENAPRDLEAVEIWKKYIPENRIYFLPAKNNWWSPGDNGPCGPDSEMFYDVTGKLGDMTHDEYVAADDRGDVVEIWNDVFMEYEKRDGKVIGKLSQKNVDTGSGLERVTMVAQGKSNVFEIDVFASLINKIEQFPGVLDEKTKRIIADHVRTAVFMIADGVTPQSTDRGYVLRRLLRRAILRAYQLAPGFSNLYPLTDIVVGAYKDSYPELIEKRRQIAQVFEAEEVKFMKTLDQGMKELENIAYKIENGAFTESIKRKNLSGLEAFNLYQTYGFPIEITLEVCKEKNIEVDIDDFKQRMRTHQDLSRSGSEQKFKGGLANTNEQTVKLHTAHHLLLAALQELVSKDIHQRGSNITEERLRMDFSFDRKVTPEELQKVEDLVNSWIEAKLPVIRREMPREEAEKLGAEMEFGAKYPDMVSVYTIQGSDDKYISKEFCGGPHVENTGDIGPFKIQKEEASSAGVRRIKAIIA